MSISGDEEKTFIDFLWNLNNDRYINEMTISRNRQETMPFSTVSTVKLFFNKALAHFLWEMYAIRNMFTFPGVETFWHYIEM